MNSVQFKKEYQELKQQAKKYYNENVKDKILEFEKTRLDYIFIVILLYILLAFLVYLFIINIIGIDDKVVFWIVTIPFSLFLIVFYMFLAAHLNYCYKKKIKILYPQLLKLFNLKYKKDTNSNNIRYSIDSSKLFYNSNTMTTDDRFIGNFNGVDIEIAEFALCRKSEMSNGSYDGALSPSFKGLAITFDSNKKIKALTHIKPKLHNLSLIPHIGFGESVVLLVGGSHFIFGVAAIISSIFFHTGMPFWFGIPFASWPIIFLYFFYNHIMKKKKKSKHKKFQPVKVEDIIFSKDYDIYSYDQIESRYLITPAFIERFMFLQKVFKTKNICCAFVEDKILLLISSKKDLFEIGNLFTSLKNPKCVEKFYDEIMAILLLVNHFKLNEHIGL